MPFGAILGRLHPRTAEIRGYTRSALPVLMVTVAIAIPMDLAVPNGFYWFHHHARGETI